MRVCGNDSERVDACVDVCEGLECAGESRIQLEATHMHAAQPLSPSLPSFSSLLRADAAVLSMTGRCFDKRIHHRYFTAGDRLEVGQRCRAELVDLRLTARQRRCLSHGGGQSKRKSRCLSPTMAVES